MRVRIWMLSLALLGPAWMARADQPAPPPAPESKKPVRVGPTTVTVIDEQESVDDIISRVRRARAERGTRAAPPAVQPAEQSPREKVKAKLTETRDKDRLSRKEARERAQRLRENLRERRANRIKAARAE